MTVSNKQGVNKVILMNVWEFLGELLQNNLLFPVCRILKDFEVQTLLIVLVFNNQIV